MKENPSDLRKKIARYRRSRVVMYDPEMIELIDRVIRETQERIEIVERRYGSP